MEYVWKDRKRVLFGLPWSFTKYRLTEEKLFVCTGFFNRHEEEVRLYRIMDITLNRTFGQRIFKLGTIHICSSDKTTPEFDLKRIKKSKHVRDLLSDLVEEERQRKRIAGREYMDSHDDVHDAFEEHMHI